MNKIILNGMVSSEVEFSHEVVGEKFYTFFLNTERTSGIADVVKCMIPELYIDDIKVGNNVKLDGEIRTFNKIEEDRRKLDIFVFVTQKPEIQEEPEKYITNDGIIKGYICKKMPSRITPNGRHIAEVVVAVNRSYGKSDYIPCITWGRNAERVDRFEIGKPVTLEGRLQSRTYKKCVGEGEYVEKIAYEFSARTIGEYTPATDEDITIEN